MASGLAFSSLTRDRGSLGPIEGLAPLGTHQGLLPGSSPLGQKGGRRRGGEELAFSTPKSIGDGVYVLCLLQLRIARGGYSTVSRGGLRVQDEPEPRPVVIKVMMLSNEEDEKMAVNKISLRRLLGSHDIMVHLMAALVPARARYGGLDRCLQEQGAIEVPKMCWKGALEVPHRCLQGLRNP